MTTTGKIDWQNCFIQEFTGPAPVIEIQDGHETYCASIPAGMAAADMCNEFASTYAFNADGPQTLVDCSWTEYADAGEEWREQDGGSFQVEP